MYTIQKTTEINGTITTIYYTEKENHLGKAWWTQEERNAKIFEKEQDAEIIANIGKPTIKPKQ